MKFGDFSLDIENGRLLRDGVPVPLSHRAVLLLASFIERRGETLTKGDLMDAGWPGAIVEESNLTVQIAALRKALGTTPEGHDWIATVPRIGYRFASEPTPMVVNGPSASIAVLPFANISSDPEQEFFAAGLSEDLITDLSRVSGLMVIARNSSFSYRERQGPPGDIARELGVRYLVQGSVRRSESRVRINVQLIDTSMQRSIWADRFDGELRDVFALQDQVVGRIVQALAAVLPSADSPKPRRHTSLEAYDYFARGRTVALQSAEGFQLATQLLLKATEIDPGFAEAFAWLAMSQVHGWLHWGQPQSSVEQAVQWARRGVQLDAHNADAHAFLGYVLNFNKKIAESATEFDTALGINPNHADALALRAEVLISLGHTAEAVETTLAAFRLNPYPPHWYHWMLGFALFADGRYGQAVEALRHVSTRPTVSARILAAGLAHLGEVAEAREVARDFLAMSSQFRISDWLAAQPLQDETARRFAEGYRLAGLPE